jgi:putative transposase
MQKWRNWEAAEEADWLAALKRESVIGPLAAQSRPGAQLVQNAARELGLGRSVVYELLRRYRLRSQTSSLLPGKRGRAQISVLGRDREQLLGACIQDFYLKPERPRLLDLVLEVRRRFAEQQLPAPNYRTVVNRVEALDLRLATAKREGGKKAQELVGPVALSTLQPEHPTDLLQIDHTPVDVIVLDQQKRLPIGRPWLTLAIDVCTRMVAGFLDKGRDLKHAATAFSRPKVQQYDLSPVVREAHLLAVFGHKLEGWRWFPAFGCGKRRVFILLTVESRHNGRAHNC